MIRSAQDVIKVAESRGFQIRVNAGPPPMPVLCVPRTADRSLVTDVLLDALRAWRLEIIEEVTAKE